MLMRSCSLAQAEDGDDQAANQTVATQLAVDNAPMSDAIQKRIIEYQSAIKEKETQLKVL